MKDIAGTALCNLSPTFSIHDKRPTIISNRIAAQLIP
jgi:hypothetical protein